MLRYQLLLVYIYLVSLFLETLFYFLFFGFDESVWTLTSIFMRGLRKVLTRLLTRVFMRVLTRVFMTVLKRVLTRVLRSSVYFNNIVAHILLHYEHKIFFFFIFFYEVGWFLIFKLIFCFGARIDCEIVHRPFPGHLWWNTSSIHHSWWVHTLECCDQDISTFDMWFHLPSWSPISFWALMFSR